MTKLIRGGRVLDPASGRDGTFDLLIENGTVSRIEKSIPSPPPGTEIIDVCLADPNAKDARLIVDVVLNEYLKYTGEATNAEDERLYRQLVDQYKSMETEIKGREKVCAELQKSPR